MNYLEEIKPYYKRVQLYNQGKGCPNHETLIKIADIEYKLKESEKVRMYGSNNVEIYPTDVGCNGCVRSMMQNLERWYNILSKEQPTKETVEFKGVPQKVVEKEINTLGSNDTTSITIGDDYEMKPVSEEVLPYDGPLLANPYTLKWGAFKTYCKEQGINTKGKKRTELEDELKAL